MLKDFPQGPYRIAARFTVYRFIGLALCLAGIATAVIIYGRESLHAAQAILPW